MSQRSQLPCLSSLTSPLGCPSGGGGGTADTLVSETSGTDAIADTSVPIDLQESDVLTVSDVLSDNDSPSLPDASEPDDASPTDATIEADASVIDGLLEDITVDAVGDTNISSDTSESDVALPEGCECDPRFADRK